MEFLKKSYLDIVYCQNVFGYTLQHFLTHFALFHHHFDPFWGDLLKKLRLDATLEARFRGSERASTGSKRIFFPKKLYLGIVYYQNVFGYTLQHFWTHFALFCHHFDWFWGDLLKKLRLDATLEARV